MKPVEYVANEVIVSEKLHLLGQHIVGTLNNQADLGKFFQKTLVISCTNKMAVHFMRSDAPAVALYIESIKHSTVVCTIINLQ